MANFSIPNLSSRDLALHLHSKMLPTINSFDFKTNPTTLNILHHNARSLIKRIPSYSTIKAISNTHIFCISETFLKSHHSNSLCTLPNFNIERNDRDSASNKTYGGGSAILIRDNIVYKRLDQPTTVLKSVCDSVWLEIRTQKSKKLIIASIYRPPDSDKTKFVRLFDNVLTTCLPESTDLVIMGDININWNSSSPIKTHLSDITVLKGLEQVINGPTYTSAEGRESTIDLSFVTKNANHNGNGVLVSDLSDHYFIYSSILTSPLKKARKLILTRPYSKLDHNKLFHDACHLPFHTITSLSKCPHKQAEILEENIKTLLDSHIPAKLLRVRNFVPKWLTPDLLKLIRLKNKFFNKVYKQNPTNPTQSQITQYKKFRNMVTQKIRVAKRNLVQDALTKDTASFYKCARSLFGTTSFTSLPTQILNNGSYISDDKAIAECFNSHFSKILSPCHIKNPKESRAMSNFAFHPVSSSDILAILQSLKDKKGGVTQIPASIYQLLAPLIVGPLTDIINNCIKLGIFPNSYKIGLVTPIFKKGNRADVQNYRPISSLPILSKVFEKVLSGQLSLYLEKHNLLSERQHGFRKHHSTQHMLLTLIEPWLKALDSPSPCFISALSLDITKAFDTVSHNYLAALLPSYGLDELSCALLSSYLTNRKQVVKIGCSLSEPSKINAGVPQGSVLGPLLFNIVVNGLLKTVDSAIAYADDTVIYAIGRTQLESNLAAHKLLDKAVKWYNFAGMTLNLKKTNYCIFANRTIDSSRQINYENTHLPIANSLKILGVTLNSNLSMSKHCQNIVSKLSGINSLFGKCRNYLDLPQALQVYLTIIRPHLEYCPLLLTSLSSYDSDLLEKCQNRAIRIILNAPRTLSMTDGRILLGVHTLSSRRKYFFAKFIEHNLKKKKVAHSILSLFSSHINPKLTLNLRNSCRLILPTPRTQYGKRTFAYQCIKYQKSTNPKPKEFLSYYIQHT